jgi:hypothetical protein
MDAYILSLIIGFLLASLSMWLVHMINGRSAKS